MRRSRVLLVLAWTAFLLYLVLSHSVRAFLADAARLVHRVLA